MKKPYSIIEKAKKINARHGGRPSAPVSSDEISLSIAYARGQVTGQQAWLALGRKFEDNSRVNARVAVVLKHAIRIGLLVEAKR